MLDEGMLQSLMELPEQYNYGMYAKFINDYGTHYITSGSMGGTYEFILVLDKNKMKSLGKSIMILLFLKIYFINMLIKLFKNINLYCTLKGAYIY